jgi:hypothetical protein
MILDYKFTLVGALAAGVGGRRDQERGGGGREGRDPHYRR